MTGPHDSIIGVDVEAALGRFRTAMPARFETASGNPRLNGVVIEADETTGLALEIERISYSLDELEDLARASGPDAGPEQAAVPFPNMPSPFGLPFDEPEPGPASRRQPRRPPGGSRLAASGSRRHSPAAAPPTVHAPARQTAGSRQVLTRDPADHRDSRSARVGVPLRLGRRGTLELQALEHRPPLLHAEGRPVAAQGLHVPHAAAVPEVQAG